MRAIATKIGEMIMRYRLCLVLLCAAAIAGPAVAGQREETAGYSIASLNTPDPYFVPSGNTVPITVSVASPGEMQRVVVKLNGDNVTSELLANGPETLAGSVSGLLPGMNLLEVFHDSRELRPVASLKVALARAPVVSCSAASFSAGSLPVPNTVITSVTQVAATSTVPAHCLITGTIDAGRVGYPSSPSAPVSVYTYAIGWQVRLPLAWSGRYIGEGGGGTDGSIPGTTSRLVDGFAEAGDDSGHDNNVNSDPLAAGRGSFGTDFQARVDFAYRAIALTTQIAKSLIATYYGRPAAYSYFEGCSMGGRETMMVTQRLPDDFNGVIVGDPGFQFPTSATKSIYESQVFGQLAQSMGLYTVDGLPLYSNTFTDQDLQLISNTILQACDKLDGLADGMVNNPMACTTARVTPYLNALKCSGSKTPTCLTGGQIQAIEKFYAGPVTPSAKRPYDGWIWDPGIAGCTSAVDCNTPTATNIAGGWRSWNLGSYQTNLVTAVLQVQGGGPATTTVLPNPPVLPAPVANEGLTKLMMSWNLDDYVASLHATTTAFPVSSYDLLQVDSTHLNAYRSHGGKMIIWQPQTGGPFSPLAMVHWYEDLNHEYGGTAANYHKVRSFARLFLMPGSQHCGGGPATSTITPLDSIIGWVEDGLAPASLLGTAPANTPWPGRTRPLCPFPQYAHYVGSGDINQAQNFVCGGDMTGNQQDGHRGD